MSLTATPTVPENAETRRGIGAALGASAGAPAVGAVVALTRSRSRKEKRGAPKGAPQSRWRLADLVRDRPCCRHEGRLRRLCTGALRRLEPRSAEVLPDA